MLSSAGTCCIIYASNNYDHVITMSKNQSAHFPGSQLINLCANSCKLINYGIKRSGQQKFGGLCQHYQLFRIFSAILVLHHPTLGYSERHFYFELSEIAKIRVSGIINR